MDYRGVFSCKKFFCFAMEEFIFMVNFDEIEFLDCEIVEDDPDAPVGILLHVLEDGTVEENRPVDSQNDASIDVVEQNAVETEKQEIAEESVEVALDEPVQDEIQPESEIIAPEQEEIVEDKAEQEPTQAVESIEPIIDSKPVQDNEPSVEQEAVEDTSTEPVIEDIAPDQEIVQETTIVEENAENAPFEEAPQEPAIVENEHIETAVEEPIKEVKKPATKKKATPKKAKVETTQKDESKDEKKTIDLKGDGSVNDALFATSFEIEKPVKTKVVSTKKKQEKQEDLWAVAPLAKPKKEEKAQESEPVQEPKKKPARKKAEKPVESEKVQVEETPAPKKKAASKKTTKVENTTIVTEDEKVAKATDKTSTAAHVEEKAVKASKATKAVENNDETILVEGEGKMHGKFVIKKTDKGNFVFKLYSSNHRVVAIGAQAYTTLGAAKIGVQSIINNAEKAPVENQTLKNYETLKFPKWEIYTDKKGEYRLRLFATNGSLIATTNDGYADISGAKNGIAAVARACKGCAVARNDNLW